MTPQVRAASIKLKLRISRAPLEFQKVLLKLQSKILEKFILKCWKYIEEIPSDHEEYTKSDFTLIRRYLSL